VTSGFELDPGIPYEPPLTGDEASAIVGALERQRYVIKWKCGGLDAEQIRRTAAASTITLGGLLKHLALVEADYFVMRIARSDPGPPWNEVDWDADPDFDWRVDDGDTPEGLMDLWSASVARSRSILSEVLADGGLDREIRLGETSANVRRILLDLVEEYARHAGHADLIRESIDGVVGEDPPGLP
jgi:hypothetical protein